jgi:16S rRNA (uracil1498-N3)-methyltransferase
MTPRLFVDGALAAGVEVSLSDAQSHHLRHVLRRVDGAALRLFNGRDGEWAGTFHGRGKKGGAALIGDRLREQDREPDLWLCFAPVKKARIDYVAEKATELGVALLQPVVTQHTVVDRVNVERLRANAVEAAEQSERLTVPEVRAPVPFNRLLGEWPSPRRLLVCDESGAGPPIAQVLSALDERTRSAPWAILVGPEGGFDRAELEALHRMKDVTAVGLGPRILRADTAALAALACWQGLVGDWRLQTPRLAADYRTSRGAV